MESGADLEAAEQLLRVLRATAGVRLAKLYGRDIVGLNRRRILVRIDAPADDPKGRELLDVTANWSAMVDSWVACAQLATAKVAKILGEATIAAAKQQLELGSSSAPAQLPPTEEELEWLAHWFDQQPDPDEISTEQGGGRAHGAPGCLRLLLRLLLRIPCAQRGAARYACAAAHQTHASCLLLSA